LEDFFVCFLEMVLGNGEENMQMEKGSAAADV
jgi:hypothetical protein